MATWLAWSAPDKSRVSSNKDCARRSRLVEIRASNFSPAVSWPVSKPTISITPNVTKYCTSVTAKENRGATKNQSKAATLHTAASAAGPRPHFTATNTVPSKNSMTMLARSNTDAMGHASVVTATLLATAQRYGLSLLVQASGSSASLRCSAGFRRRALSLTPTSTIWSVGASKAKRRVMTRALHSADHGVTGGRPSTSVAQFKRSARATSSTAASAPANTAVAAPKDSASCKTASVRSRVATGMRCRRGVST